MCAYEIHESKFKLVEFSVKLKNEHETQIFQNVEVICVPTYVQLSFGVVWMYNLSFEGRIHPIFRHKPN